MLIWMLFNMLFISESPISVILDYIHYIGNIYSSILSVGNEIYIANDCFVSVYNILEKSWSTPVKEETDEIHSIF